MIWGLLFGFMMGWHPWENKCMTMHGLWILDRPGFSGNIGPGHLLVHAGHVQGSIWVFLCVNSLSAVDIYLPPLVNLELHQIILDIPNVDNNISTCVMSHIATLLLLAIKYISTLFTRLFL